jgi:transcriptional regulator with XRE-family HTH domain
VKKPKLVELFADQNAALLGNPPPFRAAESGTGKGRMSTSTLHALSTSRRTAEPLAVTGEPHPVSPAFVPTALRKESADSVLAKNLVVARLAAGLTQQELAAAADVSRATIAQIETGYSDPRLSTIVELAHALGITPLWLLSGTSEVLALASLRERPTAGDGAGSAAGDLAVSAPDIARMHHLANTGMLKDRVRAARIGAAVARAAGKTSPAVVAAAIFSAIHPGPGTTVGALLGELTRHDEPQPRDATR